MIRRMRIEQRRECAENAALRLAAQAKQDEIMPRKDSVDDLRHHRIVIADDAGKNRAVAPQARHQVFAHLVLHAAMAQALFGKLLAASQLGQGLGKIAQGLDTSGSPSHSLCGECDHYECPYSTLYDVTRTRELSHMRLGRNGCGEIELTIRSNSERGTTLKIRDRALPLPGGLAIGLFFATRLVSG